MQHIAQAAQQAISIQSQQEENSVQQNGNLLPFNGLSSVNGGKNSSKDSNTNPTTKELSIEKLGSLWLAMQALYPTKWNAAMGEMTDSNGVLSVQAKVWRRALSGITSDQIRIAIDHLTDNYSPFIPDLGEFKKLCVVGTEKDVPSAEKIMHMIINAAYAQGSIADRYKHPLAWAVAQHKDLDKHNLKTATTKQALAMITPIYAEILHSGYPQFTESDYEVRLAIEKKKTPQNELNAKRHLSSLRDALNGEVA